jgi:hypothetical protein
MTKYGVDNVSKVPSIFHKALSARVKHKPYYLPSDKCIYIQGYEPKVLDYLFSMDKDMVTGKKLLESDLIYEGDKVATFSYTLSGKSHMYYPDFEYTDLHVVIEVKSDYLLFGELFWNKNIEKFKAVISTNMFRLRLIVFTDRKEYNYMDRLLSTVEDLVYLYEKRIEWLEGV